MSQNVFGQPQPTEPQQVPVSPEQDGSSRRKLLVLGGAGAVAIALCGAAVFLQTSGGDDVTAAVDVPAVVAPAPTATSTAEAEGADTAVALAEFNGRNPFKSKTADNAAASGIGEATVVDGTNGAALTSSAGQPGTGTGASSVRVTFRGPDTDTPAPNDVVFDVDAGAAAVTVTVLPGQALGSAGPAASLTFVSLADGVAQVQKGDAKPYSLPLHTPVPLG